MDQTAVAHHSQGRLLRGPPLEEFCSKVTPSFKEIVPKLHAAGIQLAIATHSNEADYARKNLDQSLYIMGSELAKAVLGANFEPEIAEAFEVIGYNPRARGTTEDERTKVKRHHMRCLQERFEVKPEDILFFDDVPHIVEDCRAVCGVHSVLVDENVGFQCDDLLRWAQGFQSSNKLHRN